NPSTEPLEDFRSAVKLPCDRFIVKNPHCLPCKCAADKKSRELSAIDCPLSLRSEGTSIAAFRAHFAYHNTEEYFQLDSPASAQAAAEANCNNKSIDPSWAEG